MFGGFPIALLDAGDIERMSGGGSVERRRGSESTHARRHRRLIAFIGLTSCCFFANEDNLLYWARRMHARGIAGVAV